jgi:peptide/nickel transport system permease protein
MARYLFRRFAYLVALVFVVTFAVPFLLSLAPGDPAVVLAGPNATATQVQAVRESLHLNQPVVERYYDWLEHAVQGDLGRSLQTGEPVTTLISQAIPVTLELMILAQLLALLYAVPAALIGAQRPGRLSDTATTVSSFVLISSPSFVAAVLLIEIFGVQLHWLPTGGWTPISEGVGLNLKVAILPALALAIEPAGIYQRLLRDDLGRTLQEDYIMMAESKGLLPRRILFRHSLRPSSLSLLTMFGIVSARLIGGTVIVETIFGLPGLGQLLFNAINFRDFTTVQGAVAVIAIGYVVINSVVDVLYGVIDPRVRVNVAA